MRKFFASGGIMSRFLAVVTAAAAALTFSAPAAADPAQVDLLPCGPDMCVDKCNDKCDDINSPSSWDACYYPCITGCLDYPS